MSSTTGTELTNANSCDSPQVQAILNDVCDMQQGVAPAGDDPLLNSKILIVDDEPINVKVAQKYLRGGGYRNFLTTTDSRQALPLIHRERPDLVLIDIMMPVMTGLDVLECLKFEADPSCPPILVLTASDDKDTKLKALELGATDFLSKPVDPSELIPRVRNCLLMRAHQNRLRNYAQELEREVGARTAELEASRRNVILCLARAAEFRDDETGRHVVRVGRYAGIIARHMGWNESQVDLLEQAAQLHDVGKLGVPDAILRKPGKLTPDEYDLIQKHSGFGKLIFEPMTADHAQTWREHTELGRKILDQPNSPVLEMAAKIAFTHHERWDGTGYPLSLAGEDIPIEGRITAVADVFDALSTKRPYKPAFPIDRCFAMLQEGRGTQFDPIVLDATLAARAKILAVQVRYADVE